MGMQFRQRKMPSSELGESDALLSCIEDGVDVAHEDIAEDPGSCGDVISIQVVYKSPERRTKRGRLDTTEAVLRMRRDLAEREDILRDDDIHIANGDVDLGDVVTHNCVERSIISTRIF